MPTLTCMPELGPAIASMQHATVPAGTIVAAAAVNSSAEWDQTSSNAAAGAEGAADTAVSDRPSIVAEFLASAAANVATDAAIAEHSADWGGQGGFGGLEGDSAAQDDEGMCSDGEGDGREANNSPAYGGQGADYHMHQNDSSHQVVEVLEASALQQLLGTAAAGQGSKSSTIQGAGWAGSSFWKYKSAAAAIARLAGGTNTQAKKAAPGSKRRSTAQTKIDFTNLPELPADTLAQGTRKQTCLVSTSTASTLLPEDLHYQVSDLARLFLKPAPITCAWRHKPRNSGSRNSAAPFGSECAWLHGDDECWGREGYGDDENDTGMSCASKGMIITCRCTITYCIYTTKCSIYQL
eukprot:GHRR01023317.1.p1 GENE.GHRR01023317.1~~GHRR01023317.1.p1  ORF type:complete len:352 (+),score=154.34 GHRR01023317.1:81-1136(+)